MKSDRGSDRMIKWAINWVASVFALVLTTIVVRNSGDILSFTVMISEGWLFFLVAIPFAGFGILASFATEQFIFEKERLKYSVSILVSVIVTVGVSVLFMHKWFELVSMR